jgi:ABC-2 type transport system permease protein
MMKSIRFYLVLYWIALKSRAEYRVDFAVGVVTALSSQAAALAFFWTVFTHAPAIGSWSSPEVLFLFGLTAMVLGLAEATMNGIWMLPFYLVAGELDRLFVYPVRSLPFVLISRPELHSLGNFVSGAITIGVAWSFAPPPVAAYFLLPLWVVSGAFIYTSALVIVGSLSFITLGHHAWHMMAVHNLLSSARYPVTIYPRWLQILTVLVLPFGAAIFVPGSFLRGDFEVWLAVLAPIAAAAAGITLAELVWKTMANRYQSTGS